MKSLILKRTHLQGTATATCLISQEICLRIPFKDILIPLFRSRETEGNRQQTHGNPKNP